MKNKKANFDFEKLEVYQRTVDFANIVYEVTKNFPKNEQFGIVSQLRRASLSISLNIAEGTGRYNNPERRQFYRMARASIYECVPLLELSFRQGYIDLKQHEKLKQECVELSKMVSGLINSLPTKILST